MAKSSGQKCSKKTSTTKNALSKTELRRDCLSDKRRSKAASAKPQEALTDNEIDELLFADLEDTPLGKIAKTLAGALLPSFP